MEQTKKKTEINLMELWQAIWRSKIFIVVVTVIFAIGGFFTTKFLIAPTYRSGFTAFVNNRADDGEKVSTISSGDTAAAQSLAKTYASILISPPVLSGAAQEIGLDEPVSKLESYVSVRTGTDTQLLFVYVTMKSPDLAQEYAEALAKWAPRYLESIVEGTSMKIVVVPQHPENKFSPSMRNNLIKSIVLGFVIAAAFVIIRELTDNRTKDPKLLSESFEMPIIGTIPCLDVEPGQAYTYRYTKVVKEKPHA